MSGGAKRSPLDLLVLPQPVDFFPKKIDKITKISTNVRGCGRVSASTPVMRVRDRSRALWPIFVILSIFSLAYPWGVGKN
ncbi:MAG: hypothetical protein RKP20_00010 [Candidatus Competibacter sp.]|nr:hypothetical protein [Candidatus Competibacter sp.]